MPNEPARVRYFTPSEANALLPELAELLEAATARARQYQELVAEVRGGAFTSPTARAEAMRDADRIRREAIELVEDITEHGVEVKGLEQGLLDFPAMRHGVEVFLCWRRGEARVGWWHPTGTGVAGRQPLIPGDDGPWMWFS